MDYTPDGFSKWLQSHKGGTQYDFQSPTDCVVARFIKENKDEKDTYLYFHTELFKGSVQEYHRVCNQKPFTYQGVLDRLGIK